MRGHISSIRDNIASEIIRRGIRFSGLFSLCASSSAIPRSSYFIVVCNESVRVFTMMRAMRWSGNNNLWIKNEYILRTGIRQGGERHVAAAAPSYLLTNVWIFNKLFFLWPRRPLYKFLFTEKKNELKIDCASFI